jgi:hypothetical protein
MKRKAPATPANAATGSLPGAVLHDRSTGAWVVDVSEAGPRLDRSLIQQIGDVVLVCFGTHADDDCPLDASPNSEHGVLFEIGTHPTGERFVHQFSQLVRADLPIKVETRTSVKGTHLGP